MELVTRLDVQKALITGAGLGPLRHRGFRTKLRPPVWAVMTHLTFSDGGTTAGPVVKSSAAGAQDTQCPYHSKQLFPYL